MYINSIKSLNFSYGNKNTNNQPYFKGNTQVEDVLARQTLDNTQFKRANPKVDEFNKSSSLPNVHKPSAKNEASNFTDEDLNRLLFNIPFQL